MAVAPQESPTMLSGDDSVPPTPSDVASDDGLTAAEVLSKLEKVCVCVRACVRLRMCVCTYMCVCMCI